MITRIHDADDDDRDIAGIAKEGRMSLDERTFMQQLLLLADDMDSYASNWSARLRVLLQRRNESKMAEKNRAEDTSIVSCACDESRPEAQSDERPSPTREVAGSSPAGATIPAALIITCFMGSPIVVQWMGRGGRIVKSEVVKYEAQK